MKIDPKHPKTTNSSFYIGDLCKVTSHKIPLLKHAGKKVIGHKKAWAVWRKNESRVPVIVTLEFAADVRGQSVNGGKCRAARGKVVAINKIAKDNYGVTTLGCRCKRAVSGYTSMFEYHVGEVVTPDQKLKGGGRRMKYDTDLEECSAGIHFFLTLREAMDYGL